MRTRRAAVSSAALALAFSTMFVGPAFATDTLELDSVVDISAKGLESHQIFRNSDAELSNGKTVAAKLRSSDIGVVVVNVQDVSKQTPDSLADAIKTATKARYSTVVTVVDGPKDTFGVSNSDDAVRDKIKSYLGTDPVKDAGWTLIENSENLSNVEEVVAQETAEAEEAAAKKESRSELFETITNSWVTPLLAVIVLFVSLFNLLRIMFPKRRVGPELPKSSTKIVHTAFDDFKRVMYKHKKLSTPIYDNCVKLMAAFVELQKALDVTNANDAKRAMIEVTHVENLKKLTKALDSSHYLSMVEKPHQWSNVAQKKRLVANTVETMIDQVNESIRQIFEDSSLDTKISLTRILGTDSPSVNDFYSKSRSKKR